jgi:hypothetical protein
MPISTIYYPGIQTIGTVPEIKMDDMFHAAELPEGAPSRLAQCPVKIGNVSLLS